MKHQFNLFQRAGIFYCEDTRTGKQTSLRTRDRADAERLLHVKNEAVHQPAMNLPPRLPTADSAFQPTIHLTARSLFF